MTASAPIRLGMLTPSSNTRLEPATAAILHDHNTRLSHHTHLLSDAETMADAALRPFVRQFANTDRAWFDAQDWPYLMRWLTAWETSDSFAAIMVKRPPWAPGDPPTYFP